MFHTHQNVHNKKLLARLVKFSNHRVPPILFFIDSNCLPLYFDKFRHFYYTIHRAAFMILYVETDIRSFDIAAKKIW